VGRIYVATKNVAVTAAVDLFEIVSGSAAITVLHSLSIGQQTKITAEQLNLTIKRGYTVSGSGGSSVTPGPILTLDSAFSGTVEAANTTRAGTGTAVELLNDAFDILAGWEKVWTPETRPVIVPSQRLIWGLETAPAASMTLAITAVFEEIG
jgi:hypothetical protein